MKYRCVECGHEIKTLFIQDSPRNIRLMKCIIVIDFILHKPKAYRHLLYNVLDLQNPQFQGLLWIYSFWFLLFDAYRSLITCRSKAKWGLSTNAISFIWICHKIGMLQSSQIFMGVFLGNFIFFSTFLLATKTLLSTYVFLHMYKDILLAFLISSYFKMCLVLMIEFPSSIIFIIDIYVLSSNTMALKGMSLINAYSKHVWTCAIKYCSSQ
ncbi:hypothetical protein UlMin_026733 [Ulmus minor]